MLERRTVLICTIKVTVKATGTTLPATASTDTSVNIKYHDVSIISLSHAMRPGLEIRHFWVAKSLFLTITFHQKKQDKTFCF